MLRNGLGDPLHAQRHAICTRSGPPLYARPTVVSAGRISDLKNRFVSATNWPEVPAKAVGIFRDYVMRLYFPANRMSRLERLRCTPLLLFVEYLVYRVDAVAEGASNVDLDAARNDDYDRLHRYKAKFESLLRRTHAYNEQVARQMECGEQYVRLENRVTSNQAVDHADVMRLAELRPSDVRLLHGMIFALTGRSCDDALIDLLWPVEVLADIGNDLAHYQRDVEQSQFNTYAMFVRMYGREAPQRLRAEIERYEHMFQSRLAGLPRERRSGLEALCTRRYRSSTRVIPEARPQTGYMSAANEEIP